MASVRDTGAGVGISSGIFLQENLDLDELVADAGHIDLVHQPAAGALPVGAVIALRGRLRGVWAGGRADHRMRLRPAKVLSGVMAGFKQT